jgi:SulP family sulfate permease
MAPEEEERRPIGQDILAGLTVSFVAVSLGAAFGIASGREDGAFIGILSSAVIASVTSAVGGTRIQCSGPTAPMTAVMAPLVAAVTVGELRSKMEGLGISADVFLNVVLLLTGVLLALGGVFRLGALIHRVPQVVLSGFMSGIGFLIVRAEAGKLLGLFEQKKIGGDMIVNVIVALATLTLCFVAPKMIKRLPGPPPLPGTFAAIIVVTAAVHAFGFQGKSPSEFMYLEFAHLGGVASIADVGSKFRNQLPAPGDFSLPLLRLALPPACELAFLGYLDTLLTSLIVDKLATRLLKREEVTKTNQELVAQGLANALVAPFGGIPGAQATIRSVLILNEGASRRLAGILVGVFAVIETVLCQGLINMIPKAVFTGVLFKVAYDVIDWDPFSRYVGGYFPPLRGDPAAWRPVACVDVAFVVATSAVTVAVNLNAAVISLTAIFYLLRTRIEIPDLQEESLAAAQIQLIEKPRLSKEYPGSLARPRVGSL